MLMVLPKLMIGAYHPLGQSVDKTLCDSTVLDRCIPTSSVHSTGLYLAIFCIAQAITGAGVTPILTLGSAYIDENVDPKSSPVYLGILFATSMIGPGIGFVAGGLFLSVYVDVNQVGVASKSSLYLELYMLHF